jgi:hypothetical protein
MPHTDEFLEYHARYAAFEKKASCFLQCHDELDCVKCHSLRWDSHGPDFKQSHQSASRDATCYGCHKGHEGPMCLLCHDF